MSAACFLAKVRSDSAAVVKPAPGPVDVPDVADVADVGDVVVIETDVTYSMHLLSSCCVRLKRSALNSTSSGGVYGKVDGMSLVFSWRFSGQRA